MENGAPDSLNSDTSRLEPVSREELMESIYHIQLEEFFFFLTFYFVLEYS